jgi:RNA polymerase sigma factor (sigma-70 family)
MSGPGSVTLWIDRLRAGERDAAQQLWERFFQQLVKVAGNKLRHVPRAFADEEDVALSAFDSFCRAAAQGRFSQLADRHDLWTVLVLIVKRKAVDHIQHQQQQKRDWRRTQQTSASPGNEAVLAEDHVLLGIISQEPDPALAAQMDERCQYLLDKLDDDQLRTIAIRKLEGYQNQEIAASLGCSLATVERRLVLIRECWWNERDP